MTEDQLTLLTVQATLEGKIKGFKSALEQLNIYPELKAKITFTITELEEVLKIINEIKE
jgi:hypothetical protein